MNSNNMFIYNNYLNNNKHKHNKLNTKKLNTYIICSEAALLNKLGNILGRYKQQKIRNHFHLKIL